MKKTIYVLASDFEGNRFCNLNVEDGCPMQRAFKRSGLDLGKDGYYNTSQYFQQRSTREADFKVCKMFYNSVPIEDFSFEITL